MRGILLQFTIRYKDPPIEPASTIVNHATSGNFYPPYMAIVTIIRSREREATYGSHRSPKQARLIFDHSLSLFPEEIFEEQIRQDSQEMYVERDLVAVRRGVYRVPQLIIKLHGLDCLQVREDRYHMEPKSRDLRGRRSSVHRTRRVRLR
jgi:hypothetical protein